MVALGVAEQRPLSIGLVNEAPSALIDDKVLSKSEIGLEIPVGILVDLTALTTDQCERWEGNITDVISDCLRLL